MRLIATDPDVATIANRIRSSDGRPPEINLQPDFQRGEVWGVAKQRRLIDTILRNWHVPPIHVIEVRETAALEVLDGQQRLVAIRDFVNGEICVDGHTEPFDKGIAALDGCRYSTLPLEWRRAFDRFPIRIFHIVDYAPGEPGELFFRLNTPTHLTASEQRNAFFGPARQQVKVIVQQFSDWGLDDTRLGFSNSRMAFDDVVARVCCSLQLRSLTAKLTAAVVTEHYRSQTPFDQKVIDEAVHAIRFFGSCITALEVRNRFNKTTLYSWLCFTASVLRRASPTPREFGDLIDYFELSRSKEKPSPRKQVQPLQTHTPPRLNSAVLGELLRLYNDRATSRVADVSSVLTRHIVHWLYFCMVQGVKTADPDPCLRTVLRTLDRLQGPSASVEEVLAEAAGQDCWRNAL